VCWVYDHRVSATELAPIPPKEFPPARTVTVPDRGEFFLRDSGGDGPVVFLLHGWVASADLNWAGAYDDLIEAGYRVVAIDHRGHGRGLRALVPFRLVDCADDAAAVMRTLGIAPAIVVGYSMGGAIAQLVARDHIDVVAALILSGTAQHWQEEELRRNWRLMPAVGFGLSLAPGRGWRVALKRAGLGSGSSAAWIRSEMMRHSAHDIAEAGRELGRFDSRPWLRPVQVPTAVVVTTNDDAVAPAKQYELARALDAQVFESPIRHLEVGAAARPESAERYNPVLLKALASVSSGTLSRDAS
jgi:pimeloyl-ACP methyl ester carboxylesterase